MKNHHLTEPGWNTGKKCVCDRDKSESEDNNTHRMHRNIE